MKGRENVATETGKMSHGAASPPRAASASRKVEKRSKIVMTSKLAPTPSDQNVGAKPKKAKKKESEKAARVNEKKTGSSAVVVHKNKKTPQRRPDTPCTASPSSVSYSSPASPSSPRIRISPRRSVSIKEKPAMPFVLEEADGIFWPRSETGTITGPTANESVSSLSFTTEDDKDFFAVWSGQDSGRTASGHRVLYRAPAFSPIADQREDAGFTASPASLNESSGKEHIQQSLEMSSLSCFEASFQDGGGARESSTKNCHEEDSRTSSIMAGITSDRALSVNPRERMQMDVGRSLQPAQNESKSTHPIAGSDNDRKPKKEKKEKKSSKERASKKSSKERASKKSSKERARKQSSKERVRKKSSKEQSRRNSSEEQAKKAGMQQTSSNHSPHNDNKLVVLKKTHSSKTSSTSTSTLVTVEEPLQRSLLPICSSRNETRQRHSRQRLTLFVCSARGLAQLESSFEQLLGLSHSLTHGTSSCFFDMIVIGVEKESEIEAKLGVSANEKKKTKNKSGTRAKKRKTQSTQQPFFFLESTPSKTGKRSKSDKDVGRLSMKKLASLTSARNLATEYSLVAFHRQKLGSMQLLILARRDISGKISDVDMQSAHAMEGLLDHGKPVSSGMVASLTYRHTTRMSFALLGNVNSDSHSIENAVAELLQNARTHKQFDVALSSHQCIFVCSEWCCAGAKLTGSELTVPLAHKASNSSDHDNNETGSVSTVLEGFKEVLPTPKSVGGRTGFDGRPFENRILFRSALPQLMRPLTCSDVCPPDSKSARPLSLNRSPLRGAFVVTPNAVVNRRIMTATKEKNQHAPHSYRLSFRNMYCTGLKVDASSDSFHPFLLFTWEYVKMVSSVCNHKTSRQVEKWARITGGSRQSWARTQCFPNATKNPVFQEAEISLRLKGPVGAEALLYISVMNCGNPATSHDSSEDGGLVATVPLSLLELLILDGRANPRKSRKDLKRPLLKNGKRIGKLHFTLVFEKVRKAKRSGGAGARIFSCGGRNAGCL